VAGFDIGTAYLRAHGSYASLDGDSTRTVDLGSTAGVIAGKPKYAVWSGYGELGARLPIGKTWLTPFVAVDYTSAKLKAFTETGVPGANLEFADQTQKQTSVLAGIKWAADLGGVIPELKVAYRNDSGDPFFTSTARFADGPAGGAFTVRSPVTDKDSVMAGFSIAGVMGDKVTGRVGYQGRFADGLKDNAFYGSLVVRFGGDQAPAPQLPSPPPPPPPAPVVEAPPPPPPPPACNKGPYIVFFDWDKSDVTPEAGSVLDNAIAAYGNCQTVPIMLAGYADRSGSDKYNVALSERRNASVRVYLGQRGIPDAAISSQAFGESNNRVPTADGVRELQNRRVEITYGPGSGM
jgi:outer membrane protein OmpA-like peptidoglycan-associated protein